MSGCLSGSRWGRLFLSAIVLGFAAGLASLTFLVLRTSFRLTNPPDYRHPVDSIEMPDPSAMWQQTEVGASKQQVHEVSFPTADGATLRGWLISGPDPSDIGIVAAHARAGDRRGFLSHVPVFARLGCSTLLFDYREHGLSDGSGRGMGLGQREAEDISAAARFMKQEAQVSKIVAIGHSLGGSAVILAAANDTNIDGVVAENPIASFDQYVFDTTEEWVTRQPLLRYAPSRTRALSELIVRFTAWRIRLPNLVSPLQVVDRIASRPLLLLHGTADSVVNLRHSVMLFEAAREPKELWVVDGAVHNHVFEQSPDLYEARLAGFLGRVASDSDGSSTLSEHQAERAE